MSINLVSVTGPAKIQIIRELLRQEENRLAAQVRQSNDMDTTVSTMARLVEIRAVQFLFGIE